MNQFKNRIMFSETQPPWDGNIQRIPDNGTLVAIHNKNNKLVNMVVRGYNLFDCKASGVSVIVFLSSVENSCITDRVMIHKLLLPLTCREKIMIKEMEQDTTYTEGVEKTDG